MAGFDESDAPLFGMIDAESTGIIGYSMGGYGLVNNLGGAYNPEMVDSFLAPPNGLLAEHAEKTIRNLITIWIHGSKPELRWLRGA